MTSIARKNKVGVLGLVSRGRLEAFSSEASVASEANLPCLALGDSSGARPHCSRTRLEVSSPEAALPCFAPGSFSPEEASSLDAFEIAFAGKDELVRGQAWLHTSSEYDLRRVQAHLHGRI